MQISVTRELTWATAAVLFGFAVYMTVIIPGLKTIVLAVEDENRTERVQALQLLSAGNIIIMGCLGLVLLLQVRVCSRLCAGGD